MELGRIRIEVQIHHLAPGQQAGGLERRPQPLLELPAEQRPPLLLLRIGIAVGEALHLDPRQYRDLPALEHLHPFLVDEIDIESLVELMNHFNLNAKWIERKKGYIAYLKEAEKISDFLRIIGASVALLKFEDVRIIRDVRNSVNRLVNCETANLNKTISAAQRQVENIKLIDRTIGLDELPERLQEIARLRVAYQDMTLKELGEKVAGRPVSKSGVNHRLRKIEEIANELRAVGTPNRS